MKSIAIFTFLVLSVSTACSPPQPAVSTLSPVITSSPTASPTATSTETPFYTATPLLPSSTPTEIPTATPDTRLVPRYWREWPTSPDLSPKAKSILEQAKSNPDLDLHAFSKVGDCQMIPPTFLGGYVTGQYNTPPEFEETVAWFSNSMTEESITSANGLGINSVLNPMFGFAAGYTQCEKNEPPIQCELRITQPVVVLIGMGTNWKPHADLSFEEHLRNVVDQILATGALPVLATKADNIEEDWRLNLVIANVAYDYDLPLVNVWRSVQDLPNHGLKAPANIYLIGDGWTRRNIAWLNTLEKIRLVLEDQP